MTGRTGTLRAPDRGRPITRLVARAFCILALLSGVAPVNAMPVCVTETIDGEHILGISGSSDNNVIAVGRRGDIFRNTGAGWFQMPSPTNEELFDVEVVDVATAFAVGDKGTALQLVGGVWVDRSGFTNRDIFGIWAASATEAYAVGDRGEIFRWNGVTWTDESNAAGTDNRDIEDVWGDTNNVYAMSERGELYIYNRQTNTWAPRDDLCQSGNNFRDIWGDGLGNLYMVRQDDVYRHGGSSCQVVASASDNLYGIYGSPDGQIYAGGRRGAVLYFDGTAWTESTESSEDLNDAWVSPNGTAYFAADDGEITSCTVPMPNVVADWPLDDCTLGFDGSVVLDTGPNALNGSTVGGLQVTADGQLCSAAGFNGSSAYVSVPDDPALDLTEGISIAVWVRHNGGPLKDWEAILAKGDSAYRLHLNGGCEIPDSLPGNTRRGFTLGLNGGCAGADLNSNVVPSPGVWYHVAATYDRTEMRIYINGNLVNTANYTAPINSNGFDLFIGENSQQRNRYWNGDIDELKLWDQAITPQAIVTHMNRTRPCVSCTSAEFVITHDNYGIHCVDETIQVDVVDSLAGLPRIDYNAQVTLDTQTGNGTWRLVTGSGAFVDATPDDGMATYDWPLGEDSATFALEYRQGTASFDIDVYQATDSGVRDNDAEGMMTFAASGYSVTSGPLSNPPPLTIGPFAATQVAGVGFPIYISAFGQTPNDPECGVIESYDGSRDLQVWFDYANPATGSIAPGVDGISAAGSEAAAGTQAVVFDNGQAIVTGRYKDAGQIQLFFNDDNVADPNQPDGIRGATAPFVVKPFTFLLSGIQDGGGTPNPAAADATELAFVAAGAPFTVTVSALDADGDVTPNYGREFIPETVGLTANLVDPIGGDNPSITSGAGFGPFTAGQATGFDFTWPEVGIITLTPSVGDGSYLNAGNTIGTGSGNVGRFFPDHFTVELNAPAFATGCSAGSFTYLGQSFNYTSVPVVTLRARATDSSITENYAGAFFRIDNSTLQNRAYGSSAGALDTSGIPAPDADPTVSSLGNGVATLTFSSGGGLRYLRGGPQAPFDADISLSIDVFDGDGASALPNPVVFGSTGGILFDSGSQMRFGRVRLINSVGSELVHLGVPMRAEYFESAATGFVQNADDSCTAAVSLSLGAFTNNLSSSDTCVIESGNPGDSGIGCAAAGPAGLRYREPPLAGDFNLYLLAPGAGHDGSTTVTADVPAWLRFDWDGAIPGLENPSGIATFGIYRGEDRRIYTREVY